MFVHLSYMIYSWTQPSSRWLIVMYHSGAQFCSGKNLDNTLQHAFGQDTALEKRVRVDFGKGLDSEGKLSTLADIVTYCIISIPDYFSFPCHPMKAGSCSLIAASSASAIGVSPPTISSACPAASSLSNSNARVCATSCLWLCCFFQSDFKIQNQ